MKKELRKKYIDIRRNIENKKEKSNQIVNQMINHPKYQESNVIAFYCNLKDEVCLDDLMNHAWANGKVVVVPKVNGATMNFYEIQSMNELEIQSFGIREPKHSFIYNRKIDLILVPGVAFDLKGNRMGYGKGYYDQYLCDLDVYKIGICFSEQIDENVPIDEFDIKMDEIIVD